MDTEYKVGHEFILGRVRFATFSLLCVTSRSSTTCIFSSTSFLSSFYYFFHISFSANWYPFLLTFKYFISFVAKLVLNCVCTIKFSVSFPAEINLKHKFGNVILLSCLKLCLDNVRLCFCNFTNLFIFSPKIFMKEIFVNFLLCDLYIKKSFWCKYRVIRVAGERNLEHFACLPLCFIIWKRVKCTYSPTPFWKT